jgi:hypothetical protein
MSPPPANPCIYHITHVDNLPAIIANGGLISDAAMIARGGPTAAIGMGNIKQRRLSLPVGCHPGLNVGDCVPFYFCPRSVMLYILHRGNHPEVTYRGGQGPIVHLECDLHATVAWLATVSRRWAFSLANAGAYVTELRTDLAELGDIDWTAVRATDFRDPGVRERKQAEFLAEHGVAWHLVQRIGVASTGTLARVQTILAGAPHRPGVAVEPSWYY